MMKGTENETVQCICESGFILKLRSQEIRSYIPEICMLSINPKRDEEITEIERCLQQSHKEGLF